MKDANFYKDVIADARDVRERAKEGIKESVTPRLRKIIANEMKEDEEEIGSTDSEDDEEIELDLDLDLGDEDEGEDEEDLDEYFFDDMREDRRHIDKDLNRQYSERGPRHTGPEMLDVEYEDGHREMDGFDVHETVNVDDILAEYGATDVEREPRFDQTSVSTPYDNQERVEQEATDDMGSFDPDHRRGTQTREFNPEAPPLHERRRASRRSRRNRDRSRSRSRGRSQKIRESEQLGKYKQAVKILQSRLNEANLMNSKLFYTNKLSVNHSLNTKQYKRVVESFDSDNSLSDVKDTYRNLQERFGEGSADERTRNVPSKREQKAQKIEEGLNRRQSGQESRPENIEDAGDWDRIQKLAFSDMN